MKKDGKQLNLKIISPRQVQVGMVSLDPPPLKIDREIEGMKRIEIKIPANVFGDKKATIKVQLSSPE
ncbi:MAG: hypothetical protein ACTHOF_08170 [Flavisolibacter sp.]